MATPKHYAWSTFRVTEEVGKKPTVFNVGDIVTAATLGIEDDEFDNLVAEGAVRTMEYPVPTEAGNVSPIEYLRKKARDVAAGGLDAELEELAEASTPPELQPASHAK